MTLERQASEIVAILREDRFDTWGQTARRIADGMEQSGLPSELKSFSENVHADLTSVAAILGIATRKITAAIATSNQLLAGIEDTLRNPLATAAAERYRRGVRALEKGWTPEAVIEFTAAVDADPYVPVSHALLGVAFSNNGQLPEAIESFLLAVRYASDADPSIGSGCGILAVNALQELGRTDEVRHVVGDLLATYPGCAELSLVYARITGDAGPVRSAIWLAPELALPALISGTPGVAEASTEMTNSTEGPITQAAQLLDAVRTFAGTTYEENQLFDFLSAVPNPRQMDVPDAMTRIGVVFQEALQLPYVVEKQYDQAKYTDSVRAAEVARANDNYRGAEAHHDRQLKDCQSAVNSARRMNIFSAVLLAIAIIATIAVPNIIAQLIASGNPGLQADPSGQLMATAVFMVILGPCLIIPTALILRNALQTAGSADIALNRVMDDRPQRAAPSAPISIEGQQDRDRALEVIRRIAPLRRDRIRPWTPPQDIG